MDKISLQKANRSESIRARQGLFGEAVFSTHLEGVLIIAADFHFSRAEKIINFQ